MSALPRVLGRTTALSSLGLLLAAAAIAQEPGPAPASPFVPPGHWAIAAARRLDALGLVGAGGGWGGRAVTAHELRRALAEAAERAERAHAGVAPLARGYLERFVEEFGPLGEAPLGEVRSAAGNGAGARGPAAGGWVVAGYDRREGELRTGTGFWNDDRADPTTLPDLSRPRLAGTVRAALPHLAASATVLRGADGWAIDEGYAAVAARGVGVWLGRRAHAFGPAAGGGVVLNPTVPFDGVGVFLPRALVMPGVLRYLGPVHVEGFLSRVDSSGRIKRPWFWAARASLSPTPRLHLGVNRAAMFGGVGNTPLTLQNLLSIAVGRHAGQSSEFDNQIVAVDIRYRPPVPGLPVLLYAEWGAEDNAGAQWYVPGVVAGLEIPALPGLPQLAVGLERASFAHSCCGNPMWYRHWEFREGWSVDGTPLGHPLGGHGTESLAHARLDVLDARLRIAARAFRRNRGTENLFVPQRAGRSRGGALAAELRAMPRLDVMLRGASEAGEAGWRVSSGFLGARFLF